MTSPATSKCTAMFRLRRPAACSTPEPFILITRRHWRFDPLVGRRDQQQRRAVDRQHLALDIEQGHDNRAQQYGRDRPLRGRIEQGVARRDRRQRRLRGGGHSDGSVSLTGNAAIEFASGNINTIATGATLDLNGNNAYVEDSTALGSNSALRPFERLRLPRSRQRGVRFGEPVRPATRPARSATAGLSASITAEAPDRRA